MVFKKWNIVYPSKNVYNDLKNIEKNIKPLYKPTPSSCSYSFVSLPSLRFSFIDTLDKIKKKKTSKKLKLKI